MKLTLNRFLPTADADAARQLLDQLFALDRAVELEVEVGHLDQLLDIGPGQQGLPHHLDLPLDVGRDGELVHERPEDRFGVDIDLRGRGVAVRQERHGQPAGEADEPGHQDDGPPALPQLADILTKEGLELVHRRRSRRSSWGRG